MKELLVVIMYFICCAAVIGFVIYRYFDSEK